MDIILLVVRAIVHCPAGDDIMLSLGKWCGQSLCTQAAQTKHNVMAKLNLLKTNESDAKKMNAASINHLITKLHSLEEEDGYIGIARNLCGSQTACIPCVVVVVVS